MSSYCYPLPLVKAYHLYHYMMQSSFNFTMTTVNVPIQKSKEFAYFFVWRNFLPCAKNKRLVDKGITVDKAITVDILYNY